MTPQDIEPGNSYAGKVQFGDETRLVVIKTRDLENQLFTVIDPATQIEFTVDFASVSDIDRVEWV